MDKIDFPSDCSEETRLQICRIVDKIVFEKDQQIQKLEDKVFDLDAKLSDFSGALKWREVENLQQQMNIIKYENEATTRELSKFHLRAIRYNVDDLNPSQDGVIRPFDIKISRITIFERLGAWLKSLIKFRIVKTN